VPCIDGLGIIQLSEFFAKPYLESGRLKEVLRESRSAAVRAFVEWVAEFFPH